MRRMAKAVIAPSCQTPPGGCQPFPGVYSLHITAGGDVVRGLLQAGGGQGHPCLSGAKTVGDALDTARERRLRHANAVGFRCFTTWGGHTPHTPVFWRQGIR